MEENEFTQALKDQGLPMDEVKLEQFERYYELLVDWNEKVNLTAITDKEEVYLKHFYDSLTLTEFEGLAEVESLVDVGAGAGFPSLPVKILYPDLKVTIVDSLKKRINFLEILADELGLKDVHFVHGRAEDFGQDPKYRESFDLATARAVARLSVLSEFCLPLVKKGGHFVALKGSYEQTAEELDKAQAALKTLGGKYVETIELELPQGAGERALVVTQKTKETPKKYPRKAGTPNKKPLE